MGSKLDS